VYGDADSQTLLNLTVDDNQTIYAVLENYFAEKKWNYDSVGVWGQKVSSEYFLKDKDRIELYRSLLIDPKIERRNRGLEGRRKKARRKNIRNYQALKAAGLAE
jgi:putative ubiquitin-RnfH superfamily antitoxin RatB of RatAB toxin-antitoxin module